MRPGSRATETSEAASPALAGSKSIATIRMINKINLNASFTRVMLKRHFVASISISFDSSKIALPVSGVPSRGMICRRGHQTELGLLLVLLCRDRAGRGLDYVPGRACDSVAVGLHRATRRRLELRGALGRIR